MALVNLDPANENPEHEYDGDISELICLTDVMEAFHLGPNGGAEGVKHLPPVWLTSLACPADTAGLMYCIEYLEKNSDWLQDVLAGMEGAAACAVSGRAAPRTLLFFLPCAALCRQVRHLGLPRTGGDVHASQQRLQHAGGSCAPT